LAITLLIWIGASSLHFGRKAGRAFGSSPNLVGIALGSSQASGRALVGQFAPPGRAAEFFGLWGLAASSQRSWAAELWANHLPDGGNHRLAILSTVLFFVAGLMLLAQ